MTSFSTLMGNQKLLPIIQASSVSQGLAIGEAMAAAGIHLVEVVLRTEASLGPPRSAERGTEGKER